MSALSVGIVLAAILLFACFHDEEARRDFYRETGVDLIPNGPQLFAVVTLICSPLLPIAVVAIILLDLLGLLPD